MKFALIGIILAFTFAGVLSADFPSNSVNIKNSEVFSYLPNEFPKLSAIFSLSSVEEQKTTAAKKLEKIIGYLPLADQRVLFDAMNTYSPEGTSTIFYYDKYQTNAKTVIEKERDALIHYINENAKRLPKGLSCLIKVVNTFSHDSFEDKELLKSIYTNIDNVLQAQEKVASCQIEFSKQLFNDGLIRRQFLMQNLQYGINVGLTNADQCLLDEAKQEWSGVMYPKDETTGTVTVTETVTAFKEFAVCQQFYNNEITRNIIEAEISISQLKKCFNEDVYNPDAGKSSDKVLSSINYHKKKIIGINEGNGTRSDQKTQNNHTLNYGFNLGKQSVSLQDNKIITKKITLNSEWTSLINGIDSTLLTTIQSKIPFANLHNLLITHGNPTPSEIDSNCIKEIEMGASNPPACSSMNSEITMNPFNFQSLSVSSGIIQTYSNGTHTILYSSATINNRDYYDIYYKGKSIGEDFGETSTACISSFSSGGKNDKDACRDVMKTKCGNEIDFRCKQSSLYDLLNEIPISSYQLPPACLGYTTSGNALDPCLNWINEKFMLGGIIPKPSQFITYSLTAQSDSFFYKEQPTKYSTKYNEHSIISTLSSSNPQLSVAETTVESVNSIEFKHAMDATYAIMVDSSNYKSASSFLLCLLFILFF